MEAGSYYQYTYVRSGISRDYKGSILYSTMFATDGCGFSDVWKAEKMDLILKRENEESGTNGVCGGMGRGRRCGMYENKEDGRRAGTSGYMGYRGNMLCSTEDMKKMNGGKWDGRDGE